MYKRNPKELKIEEQLSAFEGWTKEDAARSAKFSPILDKVRLFKNVVMNPYSRPDAPNIPEREVREAINTVDALITEINKKPK